MLLYTIAPTCAKNPKLGVIDMLVKELIELLSKYPYHFPVVICANNGTPEDGGDLTSSNIRTVDDGGPDPEGLGQCIGIWTEYGTFIEIV